MYPNNRTNGYINGQQAGQANVVNTDDLTMDFNNTMGLGGAVLLIRQSVRRLLRRRCLFH